MSDCCKVEYIWVDGTAPTPQLRSKTKILARRPSETEHAPIWSFDGSSTNQAAGEASDCVLKPVFVCPDPTRNVNVDVLTLCEVFNVDGTPHESNKRAALREIYREHKDKEPWFGIEQEYTFMDLGNSPHGLSRSRRDKNYKALAQGPYYCSVGSGLAIGRDIVEDHLDACLQAGLKISGINAEVMPGQWEYQIGAADPLTVSDHLWVARWLLERISENHNLAVSLDPKPATGDWNGAGCHTNFSTRTMRGSMRGDSYQACIDAAVALGEKHAFLIKHYGEGVERRLTGDHETCSHEEFKWGVSDRTASVRIPWQVEQNGCGYIEDRRPNANCDPYVVTKLITETVCGE